MHLAIIGMQNVCAYTQHLLNLLTWFEYIFANMGT